MKIRLGDRRPDHFETRFACNEPLFVTGGRTWRDGTVNRLASPLEWTRSASGADVPGDAEEIALTMELGFETYREFMPKGWAPPPTEREPVRARLADPARLVPRGGSARGDGGPRGADAGCPPRRLPRPRPGPCSSLAAVRSRGALGRRHRNELAQRRGRGGGAAGLLHLQALHAGRAGPGQAVLRARGLERRRAAVHGGGTGAGWSWSSTAGRSPDSFTRCKQPPAARLPEGGACPSRSCWSAEPCA